MKSFDSFITNQTLDQRICEVATMMADKNVDPDAFLKFWFEHRHPEIAMYLSEAGWGDAFKNAAGNLWQGAKTAAQGFMRDARGPTVQFDSAVKSLTGLVNYMKGDQQLAQWTGSNQGAKLVDELNGMIKTLSNVRQYVPKNSTTPAQNNWQGQGQPGQQPQPGQPQPGQPQQAQSPAPQQAAPQMVQPAAPNGPSQSVQAGNSTPNTRFKPQAWQNVQYAGM